uniref:PRC-barrel domain-containing protein n=1 Tax=Roseihalotalea indica TaxID=2867963 RepID=A0AA49JHD9_9BACT|nr:PRC-barrel domain-containing protein [Tunicatimonas sp. TK19036]
MENQQHAHLRKLSELKKYKVADGEPDVRGWDVIGSDRASLGKVHDLVVDGNFEKVRYLDVKLDKDMYVGKDERHVLIPIGRAKIEQDSDCILIDHLDQNRVRFYPVYSGEVLTREYEHSLREFLHEHEGDYNTHHNEMLPEHERNSLLSRDSIRSNREQYEANMQSEDPLTKMRAERDIARSERDILQAELEMLKGRLLSARQALDANFYDHESFDERQFYENRKSHLHTESETPHSS